jgi:hypothetical protein
MHTTQNSKSNSVSAVTFPKIDVIIKEFISFLKFTVSLVCLLLIIYALVEIIDITTKYEPDIDTSILANLERIRGSLKFIERTMYPDTLNQDSMGELATIVKDLETLKTKTLLSKDASEDISELIKMMDTLFETVEQISTPEFRCRPVIIEVKIEQIIMREKFIPKDEKVFRDSVKEIQDVACKPGKIEKQSLLEESKIILQHKLKKIEKILGQIIVVGRPIIVGGIIIDIENEKIIIRTLLSFLPKDEQQSIEKFLLEQIRNKTQDNNGKTKPGESPVHPIPSQKKPLLIA